MTSNHLTELMLWRKFRLWLHQFNPIAIWVDERRKDREAQILVAEELASALRANADVAVRAIGLSQQFLQNMTVDPTEPPTSWTVRDEDEVKSWAERNNKSVEDLEENPFSY